MPTSTPAGTWGSRYGETLSERLLQAAVEAVALPGAGRPPLDRLKDADPA